MVQEQLVLIDIVIFFIVPGCVLMLHWSAMVFCNDERPTMQTATMMVGTAVLWMQTQLPVLNDVCHLIETCAAG